MTAPFYIHYIKTSRVVKRQCGFFCRQKGNVMENIYEIIGNLLAAFMVGLLEIGRASCRERVSWYV